MSKYVQGYGADDQRIRFAPNPAPDADPFDLNAAFRSDVIDHVLAAPDIASLQLLKDLYKALTDCSEESWSIDERVGEIARLMLLKGRRDAVTHYIDGARKSFDADSATHFEDCPADLAAECLEFARGSSRRASRAEDIEFWEFGVHRFELLLKYSA